jgi:hypothetical protein
MLCEDSDMEAAIVRLDLSERAETRGSRIVVGYNKDQFVFTSAMTESGILQEGENMR